MPTNVWSYQGIKSVQTGITAPDGSTTAFAFGTTAAAGEYAAIRQQQFDLTPGTTYTFSYYRNISLGATGGSFRIRDVTGSSAAFDLQPSMSFTGTGWVRYDTTFFMGITQTGVDCYILSRSNSATETAGVTVCLWGAQLEKGGVTTDYSRSLGFRDLRGGSVGATGSVAVYNEKDWLSYSTRNNLNYVSPFVNFYRISGYEISNMSGWTQNSEMNRIVSKLTNLPVWSAKKAFQPTLFNREDWFAFTGDKVTATGAGNFKYFGNTYPFPISNISNSYPSPWTDFGISGASGFYNQILNIFNSNKIQLDCVVGDNETGYPYTWGVNDVTGGISGYLADPRYNQSWKGLSSWSSYMNFYGVTAAGGQLQGPGVNQTAYLVWNNLVQQHQGVAMNEMWANASIQQSPKALVANYDYWVSDGGPTAGPPDAYGHPQFRSKYVGNATSPFLYGEITQIDATLSPGNVFVRPENPTFLVLAISGATGITLAKGPWTSFTKAMQEVRSVKRGSPNVPMIPWIGSVRYAGGVGQNDPTLAPTVGFADMDKGYSPIMGYTSNVGGNSAYYYELIKHVCLHGVKSIGYWNSSSFSLYEGLTQLSDRDYAAKGYTSTWIKDIALFNDALKDVNDNLGGYTLATADASRISWLAKNITSGAPKTDGSYLWRTTIKPGTLAEYVSTPNIVLNGTTVGTWITTSNSTPPEIKPFTLNELFYIQTAYSGEYGAFADGSAVTKFLGNNNQTIATFQGTAYINDDNFATTPSPKGRAYNFEFNPANPTQSSPWHNVLYELSIDAYKWGARSFMLYWPNGGLGFYNYPFRYLELLDEGYYSSTIDPAYCPARIKGFTSAIKGLLEGKLDPALNGKVGFTAINEPCNVMLYYVCTNGYVDYRWGATAPHPTGNTYYPGSMAFWDKCLTQTGNSAAADALFYSYLDRFVDDILSMRGGPTAGTLSVIFDSMVNSATPGTIGQFTSLSSPYTRGISYEMADWYVDSKLKENKIPTYVEARPMKEFSTLTASLTGGTGSSLIPGICGATAISDWRNHLSVEYNNYFQNPDFNKTQDIIQRFVKDSETTSAFRWVQNTGPLASVIDPYKVPLTVSTGGTSVTLTFDDNPGWLYTPQQSLFNLYAMSDVYRQFNNSSNTGLTFFGAVYKPVTRGIILDYDAFSRGSCGNLSLNSTNNSSSLTGYYRLTSDNSFEGNRVGYGRELSFNRTAFVANGASYNARYNVSPTGTAGYWTLNGIDFWRANVKQPSITGFIEMLRQVSIAGIPIGGFSAGWAGATYPYDTYSNGIMPRSMRP